MASARKRARRNKRAYKAVQSVVRQGQAESLPSDVVEEFIKRTENQRKREIGKQLGEFRRAESARVAKNAWVQKVESGSPQYIRGDRAQRVSLSREDKALNRRMRRERAKTASEQRNAVKVVEHGVRRRIHVETGRIVKQESVTRTRYVEYTRPDSQARGAGHPVRAEEFVQVGPDASLPGHEDLPYTEKQRMRALRDARYSRVERVNARYIEKDTRHVARHTHDSTCIVGGVCVRNERARDVPDFDDTPYYDTPVDMVDVEYVKPTSREHALEMRRMQRRGETTDRSVMGKVPDNLDECNNLIH